MNEFLFLFRNDVTTRASLPPSEMQTLAKRWQDWMQRLVADDKFVSSGNRLSFDGRVVRPDKVVTDGPYAEVKEAVAGYMVVKARDYDEAVVIASGCPILGSGGNVEIRQFVRADGSL